MSFSQLADRTRDDVSGMPCLLENGLAVIEIQGPEKHPGRGFGLEALVPAPGNEFPFRLKYTTQNASEASIRSRQQNSGMVIAGRRRYGIERGVVQIKRTRAREGVELVELACCRLGAQRTGEEAY